jgi:hypothetical protein
MQTLYVPNDHGLAARGYIKRFGKNHPEYFALRADGTRSANPDEPHPGHLCYSSEGLRREIFLDAKAYLTGERAKTRGVYEGKSDKFGWNISNTAPGYFDIMPQDALGEGNWCHCEKCWPYWKEGRQSELIWGMVSDIAGRLKKEGVAGNVTCSPYACYRALPEFSLPENIYGSLCVTGPWGEAAPEFQAKDEKLVVEWGNKLNKKLELRNYMNDYGGGIPKGVPPVSPHMVAKYWKKTAPLVNGAYTQANISYGLFNQFPNAYVLYKCLWNSRLDADELMADAMLKLFGPAAGPMGKFFSRLEEIWARSFAGFIIETPLGPMLARRTDREVWDTIFTPDVFKEFDALFDEAERLAVNDTDAKMRVEFFREKYFGEMRRVRDAYYNLKREIDDLVMIVPPVPGQVVVDGKLDDPAWKECEPVYLTPADGKDPKVKTAVRALWSADTLYIAFDCEEPRTDAMTLLERKSDDRDLWQNSSVEVFLNPSQDREKYYHFTVDANGVFSDSLVNAKGGFHRSKIDLGWNCGLAVKTVIGRDRWTAEIAIPIKALKPDSVKPEEMWVANFTRSRHLGLAGKDENQYMSWSPFLRGDNFHDIQRFGRIQFEGKADDKSGQQPADGSFEGKISGRMLGAWYLPVDERKRALIHTDGSTYRDGCQSVCLACESAKAEDSLSISQKLPRLKPDTDYLLTFWIKADGVSKSTSKYSGAMVNIIWTGGNYNEFWPLNGYWGTFGWTKQAVRFRTPKSGDTDVKNGEAWLSLRLNNASGKVWFDDVRIRETVAAPCPQ